MSVKVDTGWTINSPVNEDLEPYRPSPVRPWCVRRTHGCDGECVEYDAETDTGGYDITIARILYATEREAWIAYADALQKNVIRDACEVARVRRTYAPDSVPVNSPGETMHSAYTLWLNDIDDGEGPWNDLPDNVKAAFELAAGAVLDAAASANEKAP